MVSTQVQGYELIRRLDRSEGQTQVWEARHVETEMHAAIKVIPIDNEVMLNEVMEEVRVLARIDHKNIVHLKTAFREGHKLHIVMQYVEGDNLSRVQGNFGLHDVTDIVAVGIQVCEALEHLHRQNVCHCDVKPSNILIANSFWDDDYNRDTAVKLTDFGIAEIIRKSASEFLSTKDDKPVNGSAQSLSVRGSPAYMAPERFRSRPATPQGDIWSVGVVLHELLTHQRLFAGDDFETVEQAVMRGECKPLPGAVPSLLRGIVETCLAANPEDRYESARQLRNHLKSLSVGPVDTAELHNRPRDEQPTGKPPPEPEKDEPAAPQYGPLRQRIGLFVLCLLMMIGLFYGFYLLVIK
ncbi:MAG: serine/threonine protein kinase [Phycisphaerae bacterium]|nr:serine/threonine protein kinase [Phycisphaerae bacterium]